MKYRKLGRTGLEVSAVGFGTWAIGGDMWGPQDDGVALEALHRARDVGCNFFDTAAFYGGGHSEELVGRFIRESGHRPLIATKVPPKNRAWPARPGTSIKEAFPRQHVIDETEGSLRRLGIDCIDLQQLHVWTDEWVDTDDWYDALVRLREQGKVRYFGISLNMFEPDSGLRVAATGRVDVFQVVHNIFEQRPEDQLFPACREKNVGIIARVPFDESSLTGKLTKESVFPDDDFRVRFFRQTLGETVDRVEALRWLVPDHASSMASAALRFCLGHDAVSTVIPGIRNVDQAEENLSAADVGPLAPDILERLKGHRWDRTLEDLYGKD